MQKLVAGLLLLLITLPTPAWATPGTLRQQRAGAEEIRAGLEESGESIEDLIRFLIQQPRGVEVLLPAQSDPTTGARTLVVDPAQVRIRSRSQRGSRYFMEVAIVPSTPFVAGVRPGPGLRVTFGRTETEGVAVREVALSPRDFAAAKQNRYTIFAEHREGGVRTEAILLTPAPDGKRLEAMIPLETLGLVLTEAAVTVPTQDVIIVWLFLASIEDDDGGVRVPLPPWSPRRAASEADEFPPAKPPLVGARAPRAIAEKRRAEALAAAGLEDALRAAPPSTSQWVGLEEAESFLRRWIRQTPADPEAPRVPIQAFGPDGATLATLDREEGGVQLLNVRTGESRTIPLPSPIDPQQVVALALHPTWPGLAVGVSRGNREYGIYLVKDDPTAPPFKIPPPPDHRGLACVPACLAFSPDGKTLAYAGDVLGGNLGPYFIDFLMGPLDVQKVRYRRTYTPPDYPYSPRDVPRSLAVDTILAMAFRPDGQGLAYGGVLDDGWDGGWRWGSGMGFSGLPDDEQWPLRDPEITVTAVAFHPDRRTLAIGGADGELVIRDVPTGNYLAIRAHRTPIKAVAFSSKGEILLASSRDGALSEWDGAGLVAHLQRLQQVAGPRDPDAAGLEEIQALGPDFVASGRTAEGGVRYDCRIGDLPDATLSVTVQRGTEGSPTLTTTIRGYEGDQLPSIVQQWALQALPVIRELERDGAGPLTRHDLVQYILQQGGRQASVRALVAALAWADRRRLFDAEGALDLTRWVPAGLEEQEDRIEPLPFHGLETVIPPHGILVETRPLFFKEGSRRHRRTTPKSEGELAQGKLAHGGLIFTIVTLSSDVADDRDVPQLPFVYRHSSTSLRAAGALHARVEKALSALDSSEPGRIRQTLNEIFEVGLEEAFASSPAPSTPAASSPADRSWESYVAVMERAGFVRHPDESRFGREVFYTADRVFKATVFQQPRQREPRLWIEAVKPVGHQFVIVEERSEFRLSTTFVLRVGWQSLPDLQRPPRESSVIPPLWWRSAVQNRPLQRIAYDGTALTIALQRAGRLHRLFTLIGADGAERPIEIRVEPDHAVEPASPSRDFAQAVWVESVRQAINAYRSWIQAIASDDLARADIPSVLEAIEYALDEGNHRQVRSSWEKLETATKGLWILPELKQAIIKQLKEAGVVLRAAGLEDGRQDGLASGAEDERGTALLLLSQWVEQVRQAADNANTVGVLGPSLIERSPGAWEALGALLSTPAAAPLVNTLVGRVYFRVSAEAQLPVPEVLVLPVEASIPKAKIVKYLRFKDTDVVADERRVHYVTFPLYRGRPGDVADVLHLLRGGQRMNTPYRESVYLAEALVRPVVEPADGLIHGRAAADGAEEAKAIVERIWTQRAQDDIAREKTEDGFNVVVREDLAQRLPALLYAHARVMPEQAAPFYPLGNTPDAILDQLRRADIHTVKDLVADWRIVGGDLAAWRPQNMAEVPTVVAEERFARASDLAQALAIAQRLAELHVIEMPLVTVHRLIRVTLDDGQTYLLLQV